MYIQRLIEFADENVDKFPPIGYKTKKIQWIVDIKESGLLISPVKNLRLTVPVISRSSNTRPILLADKPDYVFGFSVNEEGKKRARERQESFINLLKVCATETGDEDIKLLIHHLETDKNIDENFRIGDFIVFRVNDEDFLHEKKSVIDFWRDYVSQSDEEDSPFTCMFCNENRPILKRHSINFTIGRERTKMISANENAYESYGLKNSEIAPTCFKCEQKYGKALEYLLARHKDRKLVGGPHMYSLGGVTYVYWLRNNERLKGHLSALISPRDKQDLSDMRLLLEQVFKGVTIDPKVNNFCLLALSANKARLVVREYIEDSAGHNKERIEKFFDAQDVGQDRYYGIYSLASTMYKKPSNQMQKYAIEDWMGWFLYGRPLSGRVLLPVLRRIQAEGVMYPQYGAVIKSWLVSQNDKGEEWDMPVKNRTDAYITGQVFAILERIQYVATNQQRTITGKFFASASTTPRSVMGMLIRNTQYYLERLSSDKKRKGLANKFKEELGEMLAELDEFPSTLKLEEQAEFALGYYHQRQTYYETKNKDEKEDE